MSTAAADGKKQKTSEATTMDLEDSQPLTATSILALVKVAIREEGLARKDDVTASESKVEKRFHDVRQDVDSQLAAVNSRLDQSVGSLPQQRARLEARIDESKSEPSSAASTSGSPSAWAGRQRGSHNVSATTWTPAAVVVSGWAPHGCAPNKNISEEEVQHLDALIRKAMGPCSERLQTLPPYVCNHQLTYRIREGCTADTFDLKRATSAAVASAHIMVRGLSPRVSLEKSAQRKQEYSQFAGAMEELEPYSKDLEGKWVEDGRALRIHAAQSWQELGRLGPGAWRWDARAFYGAGIPLPVFLREACGDSGDMEVANDDADRDKDAPILVEGDGGDNEDKDL